MFAAPFRAVGSGIIVAGMDGGHGHLQRVHCMQSALWAVGSGICYYALGRTRRNSPTTLSPPRTFLRQTFAYPKNPIPPMT